MLEELTNAAIDELYEELKQKAEGDFAGVCKIRRRRILHRAQELFRKT